MAIANGTHWEIRASGVTGNTSGGGFNPANANFPTDLTTDTDTGNTTAPVVSSATYNFVAGDVGAWVYVAAGTNWIVGWYQIASVASNKATLTATIGSAVVYTSATNSYAPSTVAGCATVGTPTGGTFGIDYSQQDAAQQTATDYTATGSSTTLTSASGGFTRMMVGNIYHQTTTGTGGFGIVGWYEIVSYTNSTTVVLDRTPNNGTANVACTGFIGGAGRLNGLEDAFFEMIQADNKVWVKNGAYTVSGSVTVASTNSTTALPSYVTGFNSLRGDTCNGSNRPVLTFGANSFSGGVNVNFSNLIVTITTGAGAQPGTSSRLMNCKFINTSTTASRVATTCASDNSFTNCEFISQNGSGLSQTTATRVLGCYFHDSATGITSSAARMVASYSIFEACSTAAISYTNASGGYQINNCTIYGREGKIGTGIDLNSAAMPACRVQNNILYGLTTGVSVATSEAKTSFGEYNNYYNNTTDTSNFSKGPTALAVDPQFVGATQITGTTATTSGSVLTQSGGDFSTVTDNVDYLRVTSGTGVTTGGYLITSHTSTTLTVNNALGTSSAGDVNYFVTTGHNFAIGTNLKAAGYPGSFQGSDTTGYLDVGAVQRQEPAGGSGGSFTFVG